MKILLTKLADGIGHQILDAWYAYQQHLQNANNYICNIDYQQTNQVSAYNNHFDIQILNLSVEQAETIDDQVLSCYDLVLICNGGEPLAYCSPAVKKILSEKSNVYFITNSYLPSDHKMFNKTIWFPHGILQCRDYWTRHFYPQYFDNKKLQQLPRTKSIQYINGMPRANRQYFIDSCLQAGLSVPIKKFSWETQIVEIADSQWESHDDTTFKEFVNNLYQTVWKEKSNCGIYYRDCVEVGIDKRFGQIPPGYFFLPLYFENHCVVFPESGWQNNELNITEKVLKCFYAGSLPFPVGGANVNRFYNEIGFYTAWNLLPEELKLFDTELDHVARYQLMIQSLKWLTDNTAVFYTQPFHDMTNANKEKFLTCDSDYLAIIKFDHIIQKHLRH
jgi:hypothetical protein